MDSTETRQLESCQCQCSDVLAGSLLLKVSGRGSGSDQCDDRVVLFFFNYCEETEGLLTIWQ
jgi:hypothetical protein